MTNENHRPARLSSTSRRRAGITLAAIAVLLHGSAVYAQQTSSLVTPVLLAENTLPDSPGAVSAAAASSASEGFSTSAATTEYLPGDPKPLAVKSPEASKTDKYIAPGQAAPSLTVGNKFALGIKDAVSPLSAIGWLLAAGYQQGTNGSPNYGTNSTAFAQRFGASAARASSQGIFTDSIAASILHEDPRYYRMGPGTNPLKRATYAVTRVFITRTDSGRATPNFALLAGNLGGAYLTKAYYPDLNTSNKEVLKTFGGSLGGAALGFAVSEFLSGALNIFHNSKPAAY